MNISIAGRIKKRKAFYERFHIVADHEIEYIREYEDHLPKLVDVISFAARTVKMEVTIKQVQVKMFFKKLLEHAKQMHEEYVMDVYDEDVMDAHNTQLYANIVGHVSQMMQAQPVQDEP